MEEPLASTFPMGKLAILLAVLQEHEWKKVVEQEPEFAGFPLHDWPGGFHGYDQGGCSNRNSRQEQP
ncbi:hypothetical protein D3C72_2404330 [compost metagenome]